MILPAAPWQQWDGMDRLLATLDADAGETRYVGGAVRDELMGLPVSDIDLATRIAPADVMIRLKAAGIKAVPTGLAHGTVTAVIGGRPVEVTTLRRDVSTDGRRATVAFTDDWRADAARRDFTINALYADPATHEVHDYFGGLADLAARRVRFIGDPLTRIAEDHLRILRLFRFHARFGAGGPDEAGLAAAAARANDLMALSRERIADELLKLLVLDDPAPTIRLMIAHGILRPVLPEIADADRLAALVVREAAAGVAPDPIRRLAALLPRDPDLAGRIGARLRLSNKAVRRLTLAASRDADQSPAALAYQVGREAAIDRLLLADAPIEAIRSLDQWRKPTFPLSGGDLIAMGLEPGPVVAATLQALEREWVEGGFAESSEALRARATARVAQMPPRQ